VLLFGLSPSSAEAFWCCKPKQSCPAPSVVYECPPPVYHHAPPAAELAPAPTPERRPERRPDDRRPDDRRPDDRRPDDRPEKRSEKRPEARPEKRPEHPEKRPERRPDRHPPKGHPDHKHDGHHPKGRPDHKHDGQPKGFRELPPPMPISSGVVIEAPAHASVYLQGRPVELSNGYLASVADNLTPGNKYRYVVEARVVENGETRTTRRVVEFLAGESVRIDLRDLAAWDPPAERPAVGSARVTVSAPPGVSIYLQGQRVPLANGRLSFEVPDLVAGKTYRYTFAAQAGADGERTERKVEFQAGGQVQVEFTRAEGLQVADR